jgi:hypothetical protein
MISKNNKKKIFNYLLLFLIIFLLFEVFAYFVVFKLENHRFIKSIIKEKNNTNENFKKIKKKYRDILPYIRDPNNFNNLNDYLISYDPSHLIFTVVNPYKLSNLSNILIQGDSWAEKSNKKTIFEYLKNTSKKKNVGLINAGISSYSPSPMSVQLFILRKDFKLNPTTIIAIIDQTDIGDEIYRYNTPSWSGNKVNYFNLEHEAPLAEIFTSTNFSLFKLISLGKLYFTTKKNKLDGNTLLTLKYIYKRISNFFNGIPAVLSPLVNGLSDNEKIIFEERINNYIQVVFQDKNLETLIFVTHPHKNHLISNNKKYKSEVGILINKILEKSKYKQNIRHINFFEQRENISEFKNINDMFEKDIYSHLTDEMYLKYYYPYILQNLN